MYGFDVGEPPGSPSSRYSWISGLPTFGDVGESGFRFLRGGGGNPTGAISTGGAEDCGGSRVGDIGHAPRAFSSNSNSASRFGDIISECGGFLCFLSYRLVSCTPQLASCPLTPTSTLEAMIAVLIFASNCRVSVCCLACPMNEEVPTKLALETQELEPRAAHGGFRYKKTQLSARVRHITAGRQSVLGWRIACLLVFACALWGLMRRWTWYSSHGQLRNQNLRTTYRNPTNVHRTAQNRPYWKNLYTLNQRSTHALSSDNQ